MDEGGTLAPNSVLSMAQLNPLQAMYGSQILYLLSMGFSKCSTALFLGNLSRARVHIIAGLVSASFAAAWTVCAVLAIALHGNLVAPWTDNEVLVRNVQRF